jgi:hypothetical protein
MENYFSMARDALSTAAYLFYAVRKTPGPTICGVDWMALTMYKNLNDIELELMACVNFLVGIEKVGSWQSRMMVNVC